jgi:hypothetical protein
MLRLSSPELRIIRSLLSREFGPTTPLFDQIASLTFDARHMTGTGYYVTFSNAKQQIGANQLNTELSEDLRTTLDPPANLVGFTLFVRDGYLSSFEGYTFGDVPWPDAAITKWLIFDEHREKFTPRDLFYTSRQRGAIFDHTLGGSG